ncbi:urease subunit gamma [Salinirubellus sp. GCM10025818]|uniref:urease subunit gamma n=1 Tax=Salinirubellus TaxID=2162630 RepID=UPI0030D1892A
MNLTLKERERLTVFTVAELARRRRERGVRLNHPEAVAYISDWVIERARDGSSVAEIRAEATGLLAREDVMEGVPEMVDMIQVEPVFPDGTKLVTVHDPIRSSGAREVGSDDEDGSEAGGADVDDENAAKGVKDAEGATHDDGEEP